MRFENNRFTTSSQAESSIKTPCWWKTPKGEITRAEYEATNRTKTQTALSIYLFVVYGALSGFALYLFLRRSNPSRNK